MLAACVGIVGIFVGLFLGVAGIKFKVEVDEKEEAVLAALPEITVVAAASPDVPSGSCHCKGGCGEHLSVGGEEVGKKIAAIMGVEAEASERKVAYVHCAGVTAERTTTD